MCARGGRRRIAAGRRAGSSDSGDGDRDEDGDGSGGVEGLRGTNGIRRRTCVSFRSPSPLPLPLLSRQQQHDFGRRGRRACVVSRFVYLAQAVWMLACLLACLLVLGWLVRGGWTGRGW